MGTIERKNNLGEMSMHPVLFVIPIPFSDTKILIYSVFFSITVALVLGIYLGTRAAQNQGLPVETALNMTFFGLIALILGARLYAFFENPSFYFAHPLRLIKLWEGSLATYGGAIGGVLGCLAYLRVKRQPIFPFLDAYAPFGFLGIAIIRFGDFLNGTAFGKRTELPWGVSFPQDSFAFNYHRNHGWITSDAAASLPVHPAQLYSTITCLLIFGFLLIRTKRGKKFQGEIFVLGGLLYSGARFVIDFFRDDLRTHLPLGLSSTQWVGIIVFLILLVTYLLLRLKKRRAADMEPRERCGLEEPENRFQEEI
jgi:phosphatidylglycerol:prolipoprotein diacylglycerol transferase